MRNFIIITLLFSLSTVDLIAQNIEKKAGPIIQEYGAVYRVDQPDFKTDTNTVYKVIFDIHSTPDDPNTINPSLNTLARFLNMHAQAGVPQKNLKVVGVVHNKATHDVLGHKGYQAKYGVGNPNLALLTALEAAGADIFICGQSINARGVNRTELHDSVEVGLSAITVILTHEKAGYHLIKF